MCCNTQNLAQVAAQRLLLSDLLCSLCLSGAYSTELQGLQCTIAPWHQGTMRLSKGV